ncbi:MAG: hypothetical protein IKO67_07735 [Bacteroidaceae bacterium]|nr:hypothetical protein [Bacteroidaceae bacterium]
MFLLPFIYFSLLTYYLYKKQEGATVAVYMSALYAFTALCAIVTILGGYLGEDGGILYNNSNAEFNLLPTVFYCAIITATIWPFTRFNSTKIKGAELINPRILDVFGIGMILMLILNIYLVADSTLDILSGDFAELRHSVYEGELSPAKLKAMNTPIIYNIYLFNSITIFALPLAFYNITHHRCTWWFNGLLLLTSLSKPIAATQTADRTEIAFWGIMAAFTLVLFWRQITLRVKIILVAASAPFIAAMVIYLSAVTTDRFDKSYAGPAAAAMQYVGQGYVNFCYFWENAKPDFISTEREFPLYNRLVSGIVSDSDRRNVRSAEQGFYISVFPSFIGDILLDLTLPGMILWIIAFIAICYALIPSTADPDTVIHASDYLIVFMLGIIPSFGIFYYRFFDFQSTIIIFSLIIIAYLSKHTFSLSATDDDTPIAESADKEE